MFSIPAMHRAVHLLEEPFWKPRPTRSNCTKSSQLNPVFVIPAFLLGIFTAGKGCFRTLSGSSYAKRMLAANSQSELRPSRYGSVVTIS
jgi:hypothetical protein